MLTFFCRQAYAFRGMFCSNVCFLFVSEKKGMSVTVLLLGVRCRGRSCSSISTSSHRDCLRTSRIRWQTGRGIGLSITIDKLRVFINKTLSIVSTDQYELINRLCLSKMLIVGDGTYQQLVDHSVSSFATVTIW